MRIALASIDPTLGAFEANIERALKAAQTAAEQGAGLIIYPAYALSGAPLEGLTESDAFVKAARAAVDDFAARCPIPALVSTLAGEKDASLALQIAEMVARGKGYEAPEVEPRDYAAQPDAFLVRNGQAEPLGLASWDTEALGRAEIDGFKLCVSLNRMAFPENVAGAADLFVAMLALPYTSGAEAFGGSHNEDMLRTCSGFAAVEKVPCAYLNLFGAQDGTVFDGRCAFFSRDGKMLAHSEQGPFAHMRFVESLLVIDTDAEHDALAAYAPYLDADDSFKAVVGPLAEDDGLADDWNCITLGLYDYMRKNGFSDCVIGLSGGLDSSVTAAIAVDALGAEHVHGVLMPSPFSSQGSIDDAVKLAENLGISHVTVPITPVLETFESVLAEPLGEPLSGIAHENLQARIRTLQLMAFSNAKGWMLVNTGNKSEAAMGFSTLYGDTAGAYAPLGDVYKTRIYQLARWRNMVARTDLIPEAVLTKPPSAELHPDQRDDDRLPPYEVLDPILIMHIEYGLDGAQIVKEGFDAKTVQGVLSTVRAFEFKRRNEPIGPEISPLPLTSGRAWPLTCGWRDACK